MPGDHEPLTDALLDPATYAGDLHLTLAELLARAPLAWNATAGFWAVARHADVSEASVGSGPVLLGQGDPGRRDRCGVRQPADDDARRSARAHPLPQARVRPGFTNVVVREPLEPMVRERTDRLLDALAAAHGLRGGAVVDITAELAVPLPIQPHRAGPRAAPKGTRPRLFAWSEAAIPGAADLTEDEKMGLLTEMTVELLGHAAARRAEPRDDVVSMLAAYEEDGETLTRRRASGCS